MTCASPARRSGFTLVELLIVIALVAIILTIGVPSFNNFIVNQRLKSVNAELVTDLQYARAEAASRNKPVFVSFREAFLGKTCYSIYMPDAADVYCNCTLASCPLVTKLKTVDLPPNTKIRFSWSAPETGNFAYDNVSGGLMYGTSDFVDKTPTTHVIDTAVIGDAARTLRTTISAAGRPTVCSAGAKLVSGFPAC